MISGVGARELRPLSASLPSAQYLLENQPAIHPSELLVHLGRGWDSCQLVLLNLQIGQRVDTALQELSQALFQCHAGSSEVEQGGELQDEAEVGQLLIGDQRARLLRFSEVERRRQIEAEHL